MNQANERLQNIGQIKKLIADLEKSGIWKSNNLTDQGTIEDSKDDNLRILNLIETELERAGLWDRSIDIDDSSIDQDQNSSVPPSVSTEQIHHLAERALSKLTSKKK